MNKYIVKVIYPDGKVSWLAPAPSVDDARACDSLDKAERFRTQVEAHLAILAMPPSLTTSGVIFSIESAADYTADPI